MQGELSSIRYDVAALSHIVQNVKYTIQDEPIECDIAYAVIGLIKRHISKECRFPLLDSQ